MTEGKPAPGSAAYAHGSLRSCNLQSRCIPCEVEYVCSAGTAATSGLSHFGTCSEANSRDMQPGGRRHSVIPSAQCAGRRTAELGGDGAAAAQQQG